MMIDHWPLKGLRIRTGEVELRLPDEEELARLADLAAEGVHEPGARPFLVPWTDGTPVERARNVIQGHWKRRAAWTPRDWSLELAVFHNGVPVGIQELWADQFATLRDVMSSSWLGLSHHGKGIGTAMRHGILHLAFAELGAEYAISMSFEDNAAPLAISRKLGYRPDGISRDVLHGEVVVSQGMRLSRQDWERVERPEVSVSGLEPCLALFGLDDQRSDSADSTA